MRSSFGRQINYSLFGESHGEGVGITIHHLPAGFKPDLGKIRQALDRRRPGRHLHSSPRQETDHYQILSGYFNEHLTGAPLTVFFPNRDTRSKDYSELAKVPRPSHADYAADVKYSGFQDYRGGGHFSARLTAPIVFAGALAEQLLSKKGVTILSYVSKVGEIEAKALNIDNSETLRELKEKLHKQSLPMWDTCQANLAEEAIERARMDRDSLGGQVQTIVTGVPAGLGEPFFDSLESTLAHLMFAIPAVKAIEFGIGTAFASLKGSQANDPWQIENQEVKASQNYSGGINGGISNGMPLSFKLTFRPTASISKLQNSVNLREGQNTKLSIIGRHDPCVVPRACPIVEAMTAIGLLEAWLDAKGLEAIK